MQIHALFYKTLSEITSFHAEGINRGITRGHDQEFEARIADGQLKDIQRRIKELERVEFEFDVDCRVNVPEDLKWMSVSAATLVDLIAKRTGREDDIVRAQIFHDALFRKIDEVREWAKQYKDS